LKFFAKYGYATKIPRVLKSKKTRIEIWELKEGFTCFGELKSKKTRIEINKCRGFSFCLCIVEIQENKD